MAVKERDELFSTLAKGPRITAYGILHATCTERDFNTGLGKGRDIVLNNGVSNLFSRLRRDGVTAVGIEGQNIERHFDTRKFIGFNTIDIRPEFRYALATYNRAKRAGITMVPLEDEPSDRKTLLFHLRLIDEISKEFQRRTAKAQLFVEAKIISTVPAVPNELLEMEKAICFGRSMLMLGKAKSLGLNHVITGIAHASDMEYVEGARMVPISSELVWQQKHVGHFAEAGTRKVDLIDDPEIVNLITTVTAKRYRAYLRHS